MILPESLAWLKFGQVISASIRQDKVLDELSLAICQIRQTLALPNFCCLQYAITIFLMQARGS